MSNRRDFLKGVVSSGLLLQIPPRALVGSIVSGLVNKAVANSNGVIPLNYAQLWVGGGIERWYFDGSHMPHGPDGSKISGRYTKIKNRISASEKTYIDSLEYALTKSKVNSKFYMPHLWESTLPGLNGGNVSMKELAQNMITIRGVNTGTGIPDHGGNTFRAEHPFGYKVSTSALAALNSKAVIPFGYSGTTKPRCLSEAGFVIDKTSISDTLASFNGSQGIFYKPGSMASSEVRSLIDEFIGKISNNLSSSKQKAAKALIADRQASMQLMDFVMTGLDEINAHYAEAYNTYLTILNKVSLNHLEGRSLEGFDDKPINNPGSEKTFSTDKRAEMSEMFRVWTEEPFNWENRLDLRENIETLKFQSMAQTFATVETYFKYNLTNSLSLSLGGMSGHLSAGWDVHYTGSIFRLYQHSKYYQAFSSGMIAFLQRIKGMSDAEGINLGSRTVLHLRSEFDRTPQGENGSSHNTTNCHESFFSNMISGGPYIVGNVDKEMRGAGLELTRNKIVEYKHIYSTIQQMCGHVRDRNFEPLVTREGDKLLITTDECKNNVA